MVSSLNNMMHDQPQIDVIVPVYNAERYLEKCLDSIRNQKFTSFRVIMVDDGSTDNSAQICQEYCNKDERFILIRQQNKGVHISRQNGLEHAIAPYVCMVDADDWIADDMYITFIEIQKKYKCDLVCSGVTRVIEKDGNVKTEFNQFDEGFYSNLRKSIYPTMIYDPFTHDAGLDTGLNNKLFLRSRLLEVYQEINYNERIVIGEDALVLFMYCLKCKSLFILNKSFYFYRIRERGSASTTPSIQALCSVYYVYDNLKRLVLQNNLGDVMIPQLQELVLRLMNFNFYYLFDITFPDKWVFDSINQFLPFRCIIYGAGKCGQGLTEYFLRTGFLDSIVSWVDKYTTEEQINGDRIMNPETILETEYDYIIIAVCREDTAMEIKSYLINKLKVDEKSIIWRKWNKLPVRSMHPWDY